MSGITSKKKIINILLSIVLLFFSTENYLIARHYPLFIIHRNQEEKNDRFRPLAGWYNNPNMKQTKNGEIPVPGQENIDRLGRRYIGEDVKNPEKRLLFLGCSYTFGQEISDEDTYIYKTSNFFPNWQFDNYAVPGYGTHQCRILLEKLLSNPKCPKYDYVFYSFMNDHPHRIAYEFSYIPDVNNCSQGTMPYADLSWNGVIKYYPQDNMFIPGADMFRALTFLNNFYSMHKSIKEQRTKSRNTLYNAVLEDMLFFCKKYNLDFSVLILDVSEFSINPGTIKKGLNVYDIILQDLYTPKYHVQNNIYHHPNSLANEYWAEKLRAILNEKSRQAASS